MKAAFLNFYVSFNFAYIKKCMKQIFGMRFGTYIDRYYIGKFLEANKQHIKGRILEVAEDTYSRMYSDKTASGETVFETLHYDGSEGDNTIIGDLSHPDSLPVDRYDCFICTQTYMCIFDVQKAIEGSYHLLKKGGVVLATVSGLSQISGYDMERWGYYWNFTSKSMEILFQRAGFSQIEIVSMGNSLAACALLKGIALEDLPGKKILDVKEEGYQLIIGIKAIKP